MMIERVLEAPVLTEEQCNVYWKQIELQYNQYLQEYNVKLPSKDSCSAYWLICLYHYSGKFVHKDAISDFTRQHISNAGKDQQVRHLNKQMGWYVTTKGQEALGEKTPSGYHMLVTLEEPSPIYKQEVEKRQQILSATDFEQLKQAYNYKCACCGREEGSVDERIGRTIKLQQGHKDPSKKLSLDNSIPQCEYCNQYSLDNFVYDENGKIIQLRNAQWIFNHMTEQAKNDLKLLFETES